MYRTAMASTYLRPGAWLPVLALVVLAAFLAEVVQPWPEGPILLAPRGLGPHGIATSDVVVLALVVAGSALWLTWWGRTDGLRSRRPRRSGASSDLRSR